MEKLVNELSHVPEGLVHILAMISCMYLIKLIADFFEPNSDRQIEEHSNLAVGIRRAGLYLGLAVALLGPLHEAYQGQMSVLRSTGMLFGEGVLVAIALLLIGKISNSLLLPGISNSVAVSGGNVAVGLVEFGQYLAAALILSSSFTGEGGGVVAGIVFFILGQTMLIAMARACNKLTPYDLFNQIAEGNAAAGLMLGGQVLALGFILQSSIAGNFTNWLSDILGFVTFGLIGMILLYLTTRLVDRFFLPNTDLQTEIVRDRNTAAVALTVAMLVGVSLLISTAII